MSEPPANRYEKCELVWQGLDDTGGRIERRKIKVLIAPNDIRRADPVTDPGQAPAWVNDVYDKLRAELHAVPLQPQAGFLHRPQPLISQR